MRPRLMLVDDDPAVRRSLGIALGRDYVVVEAASAEEARGTLSTSPDAVILDLRLDAEDMSNTSALDLLKELRRDHPSLPVIMITAYGEVEAAVKCMREGAADFIQKTGDIKEIKARISKALEQANVVKRLKRLEEELAVVEPRDLVGKSKTIVELKDMIAAVAQDGEVTVLITGESGTGKSMVARAIHALGRRASSPFVEALIAEKAGSLVESELFGHEAGAFTDAKQRRIGCIERAQNGVLFLDEIAELEGGIQVKLLRALEERTFSRVGGSQNICVDIQVVAATNADLAQRIREGRFREDLYYRLKGYEIYMPALRKHREDIPALAQHFFGLHRGSAKGLSGFSAQAMDSFQRHSWPGNVRELSNAVQVALLNATLRKHRQVELEDIPREILASVLERPTGCTSPVGLEKADQMDSLKENLARTELGEIQKALERCAWKKGQAWKLLGLNDRFALRRRVVGILQNYPALGAEFPRLQDVFTMKIKRIDG
jgi:DNA-binding NtrC family response regulator